VEFVDDRHELQNESPDDRILNLLVELVKV